MNRYTLLGKEQVFGPNCIDIFKSYGRKCAVTDYDILLGDNVSYTVKTEQGEPTGSWWTKTVDRTWGGIVCVKEDGEKSVVTAFEGCFGVRPALYYPGIRALCAHKPVGPYGFKEITFGEFVQTVVDQDLENILESNYNSGLINITGKYYPPYFADFPKGFQEYIYNNKKYVRLGKNRHNAGKMLSDGRIAQPDKPYWLAVEPIKWIVSNEDDWIISKKTLLSRIPFAKHIRYPEYTKFSKHRTHMDYEEDDLLAFKRSLLSTEFSDSERYSEDRMYMDYEEDYYDSYEDSFMYNFLKNDFGASIMPNDQKVFKENIYELDLGPATWQDKLCSQLKYSTFKFFFDNDDTTIHPALYTYIAYCMLQGKNIFRTENMQVMNLKTWKIASVLLNETNQPAVLEPILGKKWTQDFIEFCKIKIMTMEDILNGPLEYLLEMSDAQKRATVASLCLTEEENYPVAHDIASKFCPDQVAIFDLLWLNGSKYPKKQKERQRTIEN